MPDINKEVLFKTLEYTTSSTAENSTFLVTSASNNEYAINVYVSAVGKGNLRFYIQNDSVLRIEANIQSGNWKYALDNAIHGFYIETPIETEITFRTEILYGQLEAALPVLSSTSITKTEIQNGSWVSPENCNDLNVGSNLNVTDSVNVEKNLTINGSESRINGNLNISQGNLTVSGSITMDKANSTISTGSISSVNSINASSINMGANSNITTSTITNASTISANTITATNLNTSNTTTFKVENFSGESIIVEPGTSKNTIQFNGNVSGNIVVAGNINGTITQKTNALAAISTSSKIGKEVCVNILLSSTTSSFYADDTSSTQTYKVTFDAGPIYSALSSQNTTLTGLINTNKENISNLTTSLNTHKDQLTNADSTHYSDVYATTFHGALTGKAVSATTADKLGTDAGNTSTPVYFDNGIPVTCSGDLSLNATSASKLKISDTGNVSQPVYFSDSACNRRSNRICHCTATDFWRMGNSQF